MSDDKRGKKKIVDGSNKELDERRIYSESIFDYSADGMVITDEDGNLMKVNKSFAKLLGYEVHELVGKFWPELGPLSDEVGFTSYGEKVDGNSYLEAVFEAMEDFYNKAGGRSIEFYLKRRDGILIPV